VFLELGIEASGIEEEEDKGEQWPLQHFSSDIIGKCRLPIKVETSYIAVKEAINLLDYLEGESLELEGIE
jgi:hypothetical protein